MTFCTVLLTGFKQGPELINLPITSTPSAEMDIILLVKLIATTKNNNTPAATQRSFSITRPDPAEIAGSEPALRNGFL